MSTETARAELTALNTTYRDAAGTLDACRRALHDRVVDAIDLDGLTPGQVARILGVTRPRVNQIIVRAEAAR